jgi:transcriptional regulator GlxA family with amidase domain
MTTYGLLIFDGAEELDFVGPWEVFTASSMLRHHADTVLLLAEHPGAIRCSNGMRVLPDHTLEGHPPLDVLLVPGGEGARREMANHAVTGWIRETSADAAWTAGVCTGALLLHEAGPARGRNVATHFAFEDALQARGNVTVVRDARYVVDGNLITSQGVSAGIDMTL